MTLPKPYYQDDAVTIFHGDSRVILPLLEPHDLLLTDPPYGIGESAKRAASRGRPSAFTGGRAYVKEYDEFNWDSKPVEGWVMDLARSLCRKQIIFGGNYYALPATSCWLVWDKENGANDFADGEMAWTNLDKAMRIKRHMWNGMLRKGGESRWHPTQKPLDVMQWALQHAGDDAQTVLDPWMGSGTTLRAAKDAGRKATGIEREEKYCRMAADRMGQEVMSFI